MRQTAEKKLSQDPASQLHLFLRGGDVLMKGSNSAPDHRVIFM
jgi:hypothetical protein